MSSNNKSIARYNLASAISRLSSRFLDLLLVVAILVLIAFGMFFKQLTLPDWKLLLFSIICFLSFFVYFILIPFLTKGQTLFMKIFKLKCHSLTLQYFSIEKKYVHKKRLIFLWQLVLREMFLWVIILVSFIIFSIVCMIQDNDVWNFIVELIQRKSNITVYSVIASILITLMGTSGALAMILLINIIICNKKRSINDHFSNTVIIKTVDVSGNDSNGNKNFKETKTINMRYRLPGEIDPKAIDELGEEQDG